MDIKLPRLSEGVESGTVVNILVAEGQAIKKDQPFMELETQKAVGSIPSPESGTVTKIHVKEGMEVAVGQVLISIDAQRGDGAATPSSAGGVQAKAVPQRAQPAAAPTARQPGAAEQPDDYRYKSTSGLPPPAAPSIRKIASDLGIDLTRVKGSESGGRIVLEDLRAYIERLQHLAYETKPSAAAESRSEAPAKAPASEAVDFSKWGPVRREKLSPLRRTVSQRMVQSWTTVPKINQFDDADITRLLALRKKYAAAYEQKQTRLTLTAFIVRAVAGALKKHPRTNASLDETTQEIVYKDYCHIGIAVDTEGGLIVPVLHDADKKNLFELSSEINGLTERTRARKIAMQELQGGSFTISNQGSIGGSHFTPIVYAPQVAILGVGQGGAKPVIADGKIVVRTLLPLCFAYDHRVLDGADAVRFLKDVIHSLEAFPESEVALG